MLSTISPLSALWPPSAHSAFAQPQSSDEAAEIKTWLYGLQDGQMFACRGRDYEFDSIMHALQTDHPDAIEASLSPKLTNWEYGVGIKMARSVFLLWETKVEKHDIGSLDLISLLHVCSERVSQPPIPRGLPSAVSNAPTVVILCHGFSPELGPLYPLLIILRDFLTANGFPVIQPDFTATYELLPLTPAPYIHWIYVLMWCGPQVPLRLISRTKRSCLHRT